MTRKRKTDQRKQRKLKELNKVKELDKRFKNNQIELNEKCGGDILSDARITAKFV